MIWFFKKIRNGDNTIKRSFRRTKKGKVEDSITGDNKKDNEGEDE